MDERASTESGRDVQCMVMKLRRCFFLKSERGLWALIHSHDSRRGPNMMRMFLSILQQVESWERTNPDSAILEERQQSGEVEISSASRAAKWLLERLLAFSVRVLPIVCTKK